MCWHGIITLGILKYRNEIIIASPQLSTESACELEAAAFNSSTNMVGLYVCSYVPVASIYCMI